MRYDVDDLALPEQALAYETLEGPHPVTASTGGILLQLLRTSSADNNRRGVMD